MWMYRWSLLKQQCMPVIPIRSLLKFLILQNTTLRFTFDGASTADNSAVYIDYTLIEFKVDKNKVSAIKGISAKERGGYIFNCAQTHWLMNFLIENFTEEHIRQAKLWKKPKGASDWTLEPDFYIW